MDETIDVLLATYNGEKYLTEQIDSILNQTYTNINLIISDDCSTDNTKEILEQYKKKDNRVSVYYQEKNLGYIKNFEFLLRKVEHNYYMLSDQDDVWLPEKIEKSFNKLKEENADLVFTDLEVVDENKNLIEKSFNKHMKKERKINRALNKKEFEYLYNSITGCTILSKKFFLSKILPIPKESKYIIHDSWIGLIVSLYGKISYLNEPTIKYRQHSKNQVGANRNIYKSFEEMRNLFIEVKKDLFSTYLKYNNRFPEELQNLNEQGKKYFDNIQNKKGINFRHWSTFHKLYKNESISYYVINFIILNLPFLGRSLLRAYKVF